MHAPSGKAAILPEAKASAAYDPNCRRCARLAEFRDAVHAKHPSYWCRPVPPFGAPDAAFVIVGLAPGMHGANATGRPFTGDYAGILLYETLHAYGFASQADSMAPELELIDCRITNSVKCLPPANKPLPSEVKTCNVYLEVDLAALPAGAAILALGRVAHGAALRALGLKLSEFPFAHGARHELPERRALFDSYHCSRYNTNTGRLTSPMFRSVFDDVTAHLARMARSRRVA